MFWNTDKPPAPEDDEIGIGDVAALPTKRQHRAMARYRKLVVETEAARRNASEHYPRRPCKDCGELMRDGEHDWLFKKCCDTCGIKRLEALVWAIVVQRGRRATRELLERLGNTPPAV
jgi:hypothetical protein